MAFAPLPPSTVELDGPYAHEFVHTRGIRLHVATAGDSTQPLVVLILSLIHISEPTRPAA